jgi:hypothetical protein
MLPRKSGLEFRIGYKRPGDNFVTSHLNYITMELKNTFIHHVYFWLKHPESKEDLQKLVEGLEVLATVEEIKMYHIGLPAPTDREVIDNTYSISWLNIFETSEDHDAYQIHPKHLKFISDCSSLWSKVKVYDSLQH